MTNENEQTDDVAAELASLKQQRSVMKRNMGNIQKKFEKDGDKVDITILECRLQILESYFKQICHIQGQIENLNPADSARSDLEELFIGTKAKMLARLNRVRGPSPLDQSLSNATLSGTPNITQQRLPSLKLPRFDGKYADYKRFITTFMNMVHDNTSLTAVDKFNYLLNCLSGPALAVVEPFQVTDENYVKALERLEHRYDNKVLIFLEHITALFSVSQMSKGDGVSLRHLIDTVAAIRGSLLSIGSEEEVMNAIIIHIVLSKLDDDSRRNYDEKQEFRSLPSWDDCYDKLSYRCQYLESHGSKNSLNHATKSGYTDNSKGAKPKQNFNRSAHTFVNSNSSSPCSYCNNDKHKMGTCPSFLALTVSERFNYVKRNGYCINCIRKGHSVSRCPSKHHCRVCRAAHHSALHIFSAPEPTSQISSNAASSQAPSNPATFMALSFKRAIIPTAVVLIKDNCGSFVPVRVLLDSCSEINFITEEMAKTLKLQFQPNCQAISGIGEVQTKIKHSVTATIKSRLTSFQWSSNFAVTKTISARQPGEYIETSNWNIPATIELADPLFYKPQRIDLLVSTEIFLDLLIEGSISLGNGMPTLKNTVFGWIVGGKFEPRPVASPLTCNLAISPSLPDIDSTLKRFWEIEEYVNTPSKYTAEEEECEQHFVENVCLESNGKIQVRLPFKKSPELLGNSIDMARKRFLSLERRLDRDSTLKSMYIQFMEEYVSLGHMSPYKKSLVGPNFVIPHHCVLRPQSTTTKLRVVFDGSARSSSTVSLNDILMVGPTIQQDLITTLFSFRLHKFALTADISKMYRQFLMDERDRKYQLILWRNSKEEEIKIFQLNTITYGLSSSSFLAVRSLFFIADKYSSLFPLGSKILREDIYVDDVLTGANDIDTLLVKKSELVHILSSHGLELAKWNSNRTEITSSHDKNR